MKYVGLDVHERTTTWCVLDGNGEVISRGRVGTVAEELRKLIGSLGDPEQLRLGQEIGPMCQYVYDALSPTGAQVLSFNAYHLKMICSSRKKSDRRDSYWIAKALQTGMTPFPVYIPQGELRELRSLLAQRECLKAERMRWLLRARSLLVSQGYRAPQGVRAPKLVQMALRSPEGLASHVVDGVERCERLRAHLEEELGLLDMELSRRAAELPDVQRLRTIPAVGERVALAMVAAIGDVKRFSNARQLCAYAGLVPSVRQSGDSCITGHITGDGNPALRAKLIQAGHVLLWNCKSEAAKPLQAAAQRILTHEGRKKVAVVAAARFILRTAFYVLRDKTSYEPRRLKAA